MSKKYTWFKTPCGQKTHSHVIQMSFQWKFNHFIFNLPKESNHSTRTSLALFTFQADYSKQTNSLPGPECSGWTVLKLSEFAPWPCLSSMISIFFLGNALSLHPILMMYYTYTSLKRQFALMMYGHMQYITMLKKQEESTLESIIQVVMPSMEEQGDD